MNKKLNKHKLQMTGFNEAFGLIGWLYATLINDNYYKEFLIEHSIDKEATSFTIFIRRFFLYPGLVFIIFGDKVFNGSMFFRFKSEKFLFKSYIFLIHLQLLLPYLKVLFAKFHYLFVKTKFFFFKTFNLIFEAFTFCSLRK